MVTRRKNYFQNEKKGLYSLPGSCDADSSNDRVEDMLAKLLKGVEKTDENLKDILVDISRRSLKVESYFPPFSNLSRSLVESVVLNYHQKRTLLSKTIQNPKNDSLSMAMTSKSGMMSIYLPMIVVNDDKANFKLVEYKKVLSLRIRLFVKIYLKVCLQLLKRILMVKREIKEGPKTLAFHSMTSSLFSTEIEEENRKRNVLQVYFNTEEII